jgi:5'-deoxynucleotidase YfbR-like HD superfamily hydrolase
VPNLREIHHFPLGLEEEVLKDLKLPLVPEDLTELALAAERVSRYLGKGYPEGVFYDHTLAHTERCVVKGMLLPLSSLIKNPLIRTLWIHDLPEVFTSDFTSVDKARDAVLDLELTQAEDQVAQKILKHADFKLYQAFKQASRFLKGEEEAVTPAALIAKIIDAVDGNMFFHYSLALWVDSSDFEEAKLPPESALTFTFDQEKSYRPRIKSAPVEQEIKDICLMLLDEQIEYIQQVWRNVDPRKIPKEIRKHLIKIMAD